MTNRQIRVLELLDTCGERLHGLLTRLTLSEDIVGDLMQELFIRLSQSKGLDKAKDPLAYAYQAAINLAFEWRRKQKRRLQSLDQDCAAADNNPSALGGIIRKEQLQKVLNATAKLNDLARDVVVMRYIEQESYENIGRRLGKNHRHVRSVASKALAKIRQLLATEQSHHSARESCYD